MCVLLAWILFKRAAFCGNDFKDIGITLRIKEFPERMIGEFKSIIDLNLVTMVTQYSNGAHLSSQSSLHVSFQCQ